MGYREIEDNPAHAEGQWLGGLILTGILFAVTMLWYAYTHREPVVPELVKTSDRTSIIEIGHTRDVNLYEVRVDDDAYLMVVGSHSVSLVRKTHDNPDHLSPELPPNYGVPR